METITSPSQPLTQAVFQLLVWAEAKGKLEQLLTAALAENPDDASLVRLVNSLGFTVPDVTARGGSGHLVRGHRLPHRT